MAGIQAYLELARDPECLLAVNIGGEGKTLFDRLRHGGPLKACMALFPEVVGRLGIDAVVRLWAGEDIGPDVITPSALLTADNLTDYYTPGSHGWTLDLKAVSLLDQTRWHTPAARRSMASGFRLSSTTARTNGIRTWPAPCRRAPPRLG